ncbi:membrane protein [Streptomyces hygroscopicus]|nr:membrane protein [Streptomyces hygroscopicus]
MSAMHHLVQLAANGEIGTLVGGLSPDWGPFGALGKTGRTVIQIIMAGVVLALLGRAALGAFNLKMGEGQHDMAQVSKGKKEIGGSLVGAFVVGSLGTIFTIVYGMGI